MTSTLLQRTAASAAATAALLGGAVSAAPAASADVHPTVGASACTDNVKNRTTETYTTVKYRTGPAGRAKGQLPGGADVYTYCTAGHGKWTYLRVLSDGPGPWDGTKGWVATRYLASDMDW